MLVKLTDTKGNIIYINPDYVVFVGGATNQGVPAIGEAAVVVAHVGTLALAGTPRDISAQIDGKEPASCLTM